MNCREFREIVVFLLAIMCLSHARDVDPDLEEHFISVSEDWVEETYKLVAVYLVGFTVDGSFFSLVTVLFAWDCKDTIQIVHYFLFKRQITIRL